jgi:hypothetical protein
MPNRAVALKNIAVGDIFHASATNGASLICLTMSVTATTIQARNVATQIVYHFDRQKGVADWTVFSKLYVCTIDSVAPLPADIHAIMLDIDRREIESRKLPLDARDPGLNEEEKRALLFVSYFYPAFSLPAP